MFISSFKLNPGLSAHPKQLSPVGKTTKILHLNVGKSSHKASASEVGPKVLIHRKRGNT